MDLENKLQALESGLTETQRNTYRPNIERIQQYINALMIKTFVSGVETCGPFPFGAPWAKGCVANIVGFRIFEETDEDVL